MNKRSARAYDLIAFDVDGTLIGNGDGKVIWQLINERLGCHPELHAHRARAFFDKQITYVEWVDLDIFDWFNLGMTRDHIVEVIRAHLKINRGAERVLVELHRRGYDLALISGTLNVTVETLLAAHPFKEIHTNQIWFDEKGLISDWRATLYDMEGKALALKNLAQRHGVELSRTVFVGDHINDVHVMEAAGLAVAFEPKHASVIDIADHIFHGDLEGLLDLLP